MNMPLVYFLVSECQSRLTHLEVLVLIQQVVFKLFFILFLLLTRNSFIDFDENYFWDMKIRKAYRVSFQCLTH